MVQHSAIEDPDYAGRFTIQLYQSEKVGDLRVLNSSNKRSTCGYSMNPGVIGKFLFVL